MFLFNFPLTLFFYHTFYFYFQLRSNDHYFMVIIFSQLIYVQIASDYHYVVLFFFQFVIQWRLLCRLDVSICHVRGREKQIVHGSNIVDHYFLSLPVTIFFY